MSGPELHRLLQILSPASGGFIGETLNVLRRRGLIPTTSPRGRGIAGVDLAPEHAANVLLALAIDRTPEKAAAVLESWSAMRVYEGWSGFDSFGAALAGILADTGCHLRTIGVHICREWPQALIASGDPTTPQVCRFGLDTAAEVKAAGFRPTVIRSEFVLPCSALHQIACELASQDGGLFGGIATLAEVAA